VLDKEQVRSSVARRLGMETGAIVPVDRHVEGVVRMVLDATQNYRETLTRQGLFDWHAALFPTSYSGMQKIHVGAWRDDRSGPMQVISGVLGRERVHYEAPAAERIETEMWSFLKWINDKQDENDLVLKAAIAHFWFLTFHPFEDGNGRIARAIADMILARSERSPRRFYSMLSQIRADRNDYYEILEKSQMGDLDITLWLLWFLGFLDRAVDGAQDVLSSVFEVADFWKKYAGESFNDRQGDMLNWLLKGFTGKLTSSKWAALSRCSQDTAIRDIQDLVRRDILIKNDAGGRSTSYSLNGYDEGP
jgi:Fic family protein